MNSKFHGTGVALVTPFKDDFSIDFASLERLIEHVTKGGVDYLVVLGTTGETSTLSAREKKEVLSFIITHNPKHLPIVYGLGGNNTADLVEKCKEVNFNGVDGILSVSPYYNKPSQEGLFQHYTALADACPVPVIMYNIPGRTGSNMTADTTLRLAHHKNIVGIKEASGDLAQSIDIAKNKPNDFLIIGGDDILTVPMIAIGGVGAISAISNVFPDITSKMANYALASDFPKANAELHKFCHYNKLFFEEGNPVGVKAMLEIMGICSTVVRLPLTKASSGLLEKLSKAYKK
ncbi:MAG: 4-hydroxy-tetrahydrodipicolinate synthase [Cytophagales bacterium]